MVLIPTYNLDDDPEPKVSDVYIDIRYDNGERFKAEFIGISPDIGPKLIEVIRANRSQQEA